MEVKYIDHMGTDLTVVNAARVSFNKHHDEITDGDIKIINYLAKHGHWTPFSHCTATFRIKAPIFVARQLFKHKIGLTENEISRRYVDYEPEFYRVTIWRKKADNKKQGSGGTFDSESNESYDANNLMDNVYMVSQRAYKNLLDMGVCPEQARMVLPQSMYTEWYWTGSLIAFERVCRLRMSDDAQQESREITTMVHKELDKLWPISMEALWNSKNI